MGSSAQRLRGSAAHVAHPGCKQPIGTQHLAAVVTDRLSVREIGLDRIFNPRRIELVAPLADLHCASLKEERPAVADDSPRLQEIAPHDLKGMRGCGCRPDCRSRGTDCRRSRPHESARYRSSPRLQPRERAGVQGVLGRRLRTHSGEEGVLGAGDRYRAH